MSPCRPPFRAAVPLLLAAALALPWLAAPARAELSPAARRAVDAAAEKALAESGAPGASIAVIQDSAIAYVHAYGKARLAPALAATTAMRYPVGSISKQFTAALICLLAADGKLALDTPVGRFLPDLTRANDVTIRQLLSHTAGIRDYWPQDYAPAEMLEPITPRALMNRWARQPLDFEPGTRWQYSNTGFTVAGAIAEQAGGQPLFEQLRGRIFAPLGMASVLDVDQGRLGPDDPTGYMEYALGPLRPAPKEGRGWLFAMGGLAMTAEDLARWDLGLVAGPVPGPDVVRALSTEVVLANGAGTRYGLGLGVRIENDRRLLAHDGEVCGFTAENRVYPEQRAAIVVMVNQDASTASGAIADGIAKVLFVSGSPQDSAKLVQVRAVLEGLQRGTIDRALLTPNADRYFDATALADFRASLGRLGRPKEVTLLRQGTRGGLITRVYTAQFAKQTVEIVTRSEPGGRFEQYMVRVE
jgi:D-alanyl-D-alanine carboxypeptidase